MCKGLIGDGAKLNVYDPQVLPPTLYPVLFLVPTVAASRPPIQQMSENRAPRQASIKVCSPFDYVRDLCAVRPQVSEKQMMTDLSTPKFEWDHPTMRQAASAAIEKQVSAGAMQMRPSRQCDFAVPALQWLAQEWAALRSPIASW